MECLICGSPAIQLVLAGQLVEFDCIECGYYGIPKLVVDEMSLKKQKLHKERTRTYLAMRSENKQPPWITPVDINIHLLLDVSIV
ncbi:hypothetical protein [Pseudomonas danubii]|uniref:hypothetical protein n=1 Tax=Pseudomonas TaxID=286 RepID=UPI0038577284